MLFPAAFTYMCADTPLQSKEKINNNKKKLKTGMVWWSVVWEAKAWYSGVCTVLHMVCYDVIMYRMVWSNSIAQSV